MINLTLPIHLKPIHLKYESAVLLLCLYVITFATYPLSTVAFIDPQQFRHFANLSYALCFHPTEA